MKRGIYSSPRKSSEKWKRTNGWEIKQARGSIRKPRTQKDKQRSLLLIFLHLSTSQRQRRVLTPLKPRSKFRMCVTVSRFCSQVKTKPASFTATHSMPCSVMYRTAFLRYPMNCTRLTMRYAQDSDGNTG